MLETSIIRRVSDLEDAIQDYKFGLYSDEEFIRALQSQCWKLESALKFPSIKESVEEKIKAEV